MYEIEMIDRTIAPPVQEFEPFQLSPPSIFILENEVPLHVFQNDRLNLIHFMLRIRAGSLFEPRKYLATASYSLVAESAPGYSANEVEDFLDYYGADFNVTVNLEYVTLNFIIPGENCEKVLPFIYSFIRNPDYREGNLSRFKQRKINDLEYNVLKVGYRSGQLMYHALINPVIPAGEVLDKKHIQAVTTSDMTAYHQQTFMAENSSLFVAGNVDESLQTLIQNVFSQIPKGASTNLPDIFPVDVVPEQSIFEKREESLQSSIVLCRRMFSYNDRDRRDFSILSVILGGYFGSRLMQNLREKNGFTYGVYCNSIYFAEHSLFYIDADVNVVKTAEAMKQCQIEMQRLTTEMLDENELETVKNYMLGTLYRKIDGSVNYMKTYAAWKASGLDEKEQEEMYNAITKITPDRLFELSKKYLLPNDFTSIIVGDINMGK